MKSMVHVEFFEDYKIDELMKFYEEKAEFDGIWQKLEGKNRILIKPNILGAYEPFKAVTTHPIALDALICVLKSHDKQVFVGDSPGGTVGLEASLAKTGIGEVLKKHNIEVVHIGKNGASSYSYDGYNFVLADDFFKYDAVINLCKYKTHSMMLFTGAVKNLYGLVPGLKKAEYHRNYPNPSVFTGLLNGIYQTVKKHIVWNICDGILGMEGDGPSSGDARKFGVMFASTNAPSLDNVSSKMMGFKEIALLQKALTEDNITEIDVTPEYKGFKFGKVNIGAAYRKNMFLNMIPKFLADIIVKTFVFKPFVDNTKCVKCNICVKSCPVQAMTMATKRPVINYDKCINCNCCHELCPKHAVYLKKGLLARLILGK